MAIGESNGYPFTTFYRFILVVFLVIFLVISSVVFLVMHGSYVPVEF